MQTRPQPTYPGGLARLAGWCYDHRRSVVIGWIVIVVAVIGLSRVAGSAFSDNFASGNSASQRAQNLLTQRFPSQAGDTADVVIHTSGQVKDPANAATIDRMLSALRPLPNVTGIRSPLAPGGAQQVSADGHTAFAVIQFDKQTPNLNTSHTKHLVDVAQSFAHPGFEVALGGNPISATVSPHPGSSESYRDPGRHRDHAGRLRLRRGHGPPSAHRHRWGRDWLRPDRLRQPLLHHPELRAGADGHDRARGRDRLRPVHRHPVPAGPARGPRPTRGDRGRARAPPAGPSRSPVAPC